MRELILKMSVSVDGFVADENKGNDWIFAVKDALVDDWEINAISGAGLHVMGSHTFRDMISYWPFSEEVFAAPMNDILKAVFTKQGLEKSPDPELTRQLFKGHGTPKEHAAPEVMKTWTDAFVATGDFAEEVNKLKAQPGKYILAHGGAGFAQSLTQYNLVDEYWLLTYPIALGKGMPLFSPSLAKPLSLQLMQSIAFESGVVIQIYRPEKDE